MGDEWRHEGKVLTMMRSQTISEGTLWEETGMQIDQQRAASKRPPVHLYCYVIFHLFINRTKVDFILLSLQQLQRPVDTRQNSHMREENTQNPRRKTQSRNQSKSVKIKEVLRDTAELQTRNNKYHIIYIYTVCVQTLFT